MPAQMPTAALQASMLPWETQSLRSTGQASGQQLSNQTLAARAPRADGTQRSETKTGWEERTVVMLLLGNKSTLHTSSHVILTLTHKISNSKSQQAQAVRESKSLNLNLTAEPSAQFTPLPGQRDWLAVAWVEPPGVSSQSLTSPSPAGSRSAATPTSPPSILRSHKPVSQSREGPPSTPEAPPTGFPS